MSSGNRPNNGRWKGFNKNRNQRSFRTDKEIGRSTSNLNRSNRNLQQFESNDDDSELFGNLEDIQQGIQMGEKFDQFEVNERRFGVRSTYDNDLYTTKLDKNDEFYKNNERMAEEIEREISTQDTMNRHIAEERGLIVQKEDGDEDEESKYSSVIKDDNDEDQNKPTKKFHSAWSQPLKTSSNKDIPSQKLSPGNSPKYVKIRKDSTGRKGRHSGSSSPLISGSPKSSSPLEKSMKSLNLDYPSPTFSKKQKDDFTDFVQKELDLERKKMKEDLKSYKKETERKSSPTPNMEYQIDESKPTVDTEDNNNRDEDEKKSTDGETFSSTLNPDAEEFNPSMFLGTEGMIPYSIPYDQYYYTGQPTYFNYPYMYNQYNPNYSNDHDEGKPKKHINKVYSDSMERKSKKNKKDSDGKYEKVKAEKDWSSKIQYGKDSYKQFTNSHQQQQQQHYRHPNDYYNNPMNAYHAPHIYIPHQGYNAPMMPYGGNVQQTYPNYQ